MFKSSDIKRKPTKFEAISTVLFLLICFGMGILYDFNYVPLMVVVSAYSALIAKRCGYSWTEMEAAVGRRIGKSVPVITILVAIGFMLGGLMFSGTLPMLIYYGLQIVSPKWIALCAFLLCAVFSTVTGTSNGSASTAGLAMMGLAMAMDNVNLGLVAGACYAGSQFGDKLSPLSDTTVLASLTTENDIFDHIINMSKTVLPAALAAIIVYIVLGINDSQETLAINQESLALLETLENMFSFHVVLLIPVIFILWGSLTRKPTTLILFGAGFIAVILGVIYQGYSIKDAVNVLYDGFDSMDLYNTVVSVVESVRKAKAENKLSVKAPVSLMKIAGDKKSVEYVKTAQSDVKNVLNVTAPEIEYIIEDSAGVRLETVEFEQVAK